jgi:hypothetical protein
LCQRSFVDFLAHKDLDSEETGNYFQSLLFLPPHYTYVFTEEETVIDSPLHDEISRKSMSVGNISIRTSDETDSHMTVRTTDEGNDLVHRNSKPIRYVDYSEVLIGIISLLEIFQDSQYYFDWIKMEKKSVSNAVESFESLEEKYEDHILFKMMSTESIYADILEMISHKSMYDILLALWNKLEFPFVVVTLNEHKHDCKILNAHESLVALSGCDNLHPANVIGSTLASHIPREILPVIVGIKQRLCAGSMVRSCLRVIGSKEELFVSIAATPIYSSNGYVDQALVLFLPSSSPSFGISGVKLMSELLKCTPAFLKHSRSSEKQE